MIFLNHHMSQFSPAQYCCWPITNYSFITNKRPAQDVLAISAPQLPPKRIRAENDAGNTLGQNVRAVGQRDTAKTHVMTAREWIVMEGIADNTRPCQNKINSPDIAGDGRIGQ